MRTTPTERLAGVLNDASNLYQSHQRLRKALAEVLRDWAMMPQEAIMAELRDALEKSSGVPVPSNIFEALAYLRANFNSIERNRNRVRKNRGKGPAYYDISLPPPTKTLPNLGPLPAESILPTFSLEDIEAKLKSLTTE